MSNRAESVDRAALTLTRREVLALGLLSALPATLLGAHREDPASEAAALRALDRFITGYREAMNAPGLTLGLAGAEGVVRVSSYGYVDLEAKTPVSTSDLFEIGSITKSFVALVLLQLHEQGKVDLHAPIRAYLPWLSMRSDYGEILIHHLLTHSSGMPDDSPVFPDPERRPRQAFAPGSQFHYCNWGYEVLGLLIESLDARPWPMAVASRIFEPLGMHDSVGCISSAAWPRIARSYVPLHDDRPYPRHGPLAVAPNLEVEQAAGSIASTPRDMALYMSMLLSGGSHPGGRIVSEESFKRFSTPYLAAPDFGPGASYGYGIAIDELDGHRRLWHTGGMVSFMSALHLDLDSGCGAFASINAQLGYRPNPVAQLAIRLLRAVRDGTQPPPIPAFDESARVEGASSYAGIYSAVDGRRLEIAAEAERVFLVLDRQRLALQHRAGDSFLCDRPPFDLYPLVFERDANSPAQAGPSPPVSALAHGPDWYARAGGNARPIEPSPELDRYAGAYYSENPWDGWVRVVQRQGRLWIGGIAPLTPIGDRLFRVGAEASSPETAEFSNVIAGRARTLRFDGGEFERIEVA
ncbi:MAG TPA: serine hydrolase domain-containing protein [Steroidobacteraceae bacterium]|nr:serine hydrolase domain-containing protein [Steroidobacteraceae bacterium]